LLPVSDSLETNPRGFGGSITYDFNRWFGLTLDGSTHRSSGEHGVEQTIDDAVFSNISFGPKITFRRHRVSPFLEALVGDHRLTPEAFHDVDKLGFMFGGGLDINLSRHVALRLIRADYVYSNYRFGSADVTPQTQVRGVRVQSGLVFMFGGGAPPPPANHPPVASCSVDRSSVFVGSGDIALVRVVASDPDNDPLTYSWTASGGSVDGSGPEARWHSSGITPGTYTVKARVDDGRGGIASCSADIRVEPRPNRPPVISCSADRNTVLIGEPVQITATASDPDNDPSPIPGPLAADAFAAPVHPCSSIHPACKRGSIPWMGAWTMGAAGLPIASWQSRSISRLHRRECSSSRSGSIFTAFISRRRVQRWRIRAEAWFRVRKKSC
jgi:hypothetical protein